jgi:DNA-binding NtrC family response regulator
MCPDQKKVRLLLVDDEVEFLTSTAKALRRRGFDVTTVQNPAVGLKLLEHETFDVAVLDVKMPGIPGDRMFKEMKRRWPKTPVIMLTGHGTVEQAFETSREGVFDYLTKPCDVEKLVETCLNAVAASMRMENPAKEAEEVGEIHVLLVDDEEDFLNSLSTALRRRKMRVSIASSGQEALEKLEKSSIAVVLLDLKMPGMDGLETLRRIKAVNPDCEVVLLTGLPTVSTVVACLKEGAFDYVVKPQDMELLVRKIRDAFQHACSKAEAARDKQVEKILDRSND